MAYRLLVVPGDSDDLRALSQQMGGDVEVQVLDTANDALWEVRNTPPGVILANVDLPGMTGLDLAEILPNFGLPTKVVLWNRAPDAGMAKQAAEFGVFRFLDGATTAGDLPAILYEALRQAEADQKAMPEPEPEPPPPPPPPAPIRPRLARAVAAPRPEPPPARPARETTQRPVRPEPTPDPPTIRPVAARRREGGALVLTEENLRAIRGRMESLEREVGARCILLADRAGMVLSEVGLTTGLPTMVLLPLLSTSFSTAGQITQMLQENEASAMYMHEGSRFDMYCFDIAQRFMLVIVFDKAAPSAKIGSVWVYAKRNIRDIQDLLS